MAAASIFASWHQVNITVTKPRQLFHSRCNKGTRKTSVVRMCSAQNYASSTVFPRRLLLFMGTVPVWSNLNAAVSAPLPQMEEPEIIRTRKLPGGVRVQDIIDGEGLGANDGDVVEFNYVCRRANGYFVHSTVDQFTGEARPITIPLDEKQMIQGLKNVIIGMKIGGKRRALIPPTMGYVNEKLKPIPEEFGPRRSLLTHANEPLIFEVQLLKIF